MAENTDYSRKGVAYLFIAVLLLVALNIFSYSSRKHDFKYTIGAQNLEATYHTLLTVKALEESPASNHWFLPTVSLGGERDKHIPWGATIPTKTGDYVYTSFTPPGFVVPYAVMHLFGAEPTSKNLARFNAALGALVSLLLFALLHGVLEYIGYTRSIALGGALLGSLIAVFSREVLQSHGPVYWVQSLYQLIEVVSLTLFFRYLSARDEQRRKLYGYGLCLAVFLGAWTEWTGYITGGGLCVLLWFLVPERAAARRLAVLLAICLTSAVLVTVVHYGMAAGLDSTLHALMKRFMARSASRGGVGYLSEGYWLSYGPYLLCLLFAVLARFFALSHQSEQNKRVLLLVALAACIPLLENVVLMQHATQFSFDRLKFLFPAALVFALAFARMKNLWRGVLALLLIAASWQGYADYKVDLQRYESWAKIDASNKELIDRISKVVDLDCALLATDMGVRGYTTLAFSRGVYERKSFDAALALEEQESACGLVYLQGRTAFTDLPHYKTARIVLENGDRTELLSR